MIARKQISSIFFSMVLNILGLLVIGIALFCGYWIFYRIAVKIIAEGVKKGIEEANRERNAQ